MKNILVATAAIAALAAASAQAQVQTENWTINGNVVPQCDITTSSNTVNITGTNMAQADGFLNKAAVQTALVNGFNGLTTNAWCSGSANKVVLSRTALVRTSNNGALNGFADAVLFDLGVTIAGGLNPLNPNGDEGTSDGAGSGPNVNRFGPTGAGALLNWVNDTAGLTQPITIDRPAANAAGTTASFGPEKNTRLASGDYSATATLTLSPGV